MSTTQAVPEWSIWVNELSVCSIDTQKVKQAHCSWGEKGMNINVRMIPVLSFDAWV